MRGCTQIDSFTKHPMEVKGVKGPHVLKNFCFIKISSKKFCKKFYSTALFCCIFCLLHILFAVYCILLVQKNFHSESIEVIVFIVESGHAKRVAGDSRITKAHLITCGWKNYQFSIMRFGGSDMGLC